MDAKSFLEKHGKELTERVAVAAGTNYAYFTQLASGNRRPSPELARRLVEESAVVIPDPDERLDFVSLLPPKASRKEAAPA